MLLQNSASLLSHQLHCQNPPPNQTFKSFKSDTKIKVICETCQLSTLHLSWLLSFSVMGTNFCLQKSISSSSWHRRARLANHIPEIYSHCFVPPWNPFGHGVNCSLTVARRAELWGHEHSLVKCFHIILGLILWLISPQDVCLVCVCLFLTSRSEALCRTWCLSRLRKPTVEITPCNLPQWQQGSSALLPHHP